MIWWRKSRVTSTCLDCCLGSTNLFLQHVSKSPKWYKLWAPWLGFPEGGGGWLSKCAHTTSSSSRVHRGQNSEEKSSYQLTRTVITIYFFWGLSICQVPTYSRQRLGDSQVCLLSSSPLYKKGKRDSERLITHKTSKCLSQEKLSSDSKFFHEPPDKKVPCLHPTPPLPP